VSLSIRREWFEVNLAIGVLRKDSHARKRRLLSLSQVRDHFLDQHVQPVGRFGLTYPCLSSHFFRDARFFHLDFNLSAETLEDGRNEANRMINRLSYRCLTIAEICLQIVTGKMNRF
jgi:hypothetical protein